MGVAPASDPEIVARLAGVSKRLGQQCVLEDVSFATRRGSFHTLLGPNGAGKTTALSILLGLRRADSGSVSLVGGDPRDPRRRAQIGCTPQDVSFPANVKVREIIDFARAHYPRPLALAEIIESFGLGELANRQCGGLSGGEKRQLAIAVAFAGRPELVFVDEPTNGLDVDTRRLVWARFRDFVAAGGSMLITTHYLEEVEHLADTVTVINRGRVLADGTVDELRNVVGRKRLRFAAASLPALPGFESAQLENGRYTIETAEPEQLLRQLATTNVPFSNVEVNPVSLEDAFLAITGRDSR